MTEWMSLVNVLCAQTMPGTEYVPIFLAVDLLGHCAAVAGLALSFRKRCGGVALCMTLVAYVCVLLVALSLLLTHEFSIENTVFAIERNWPVAVVLAFPVIPAFASNVILLFRRKRGELTPKLSKADEDRRRDLDEPIQSFREPSPPGKPHSHEEREAEGEA